MHDFAQPIFSAFYKIKKSSFRLLILHLVLPVSLQCVRNVLRLGNSGAAVTLPSPMMASPSPRQLMPPPASPLELTPSPRPSSSSTTSLPWPTLWRCSAARCTSTKVDEYAISSSTSVHPLRLFAHVGHLTSPLWSFNFRTTSCTSTARPYPSTSCSVSHALRPHPPPAFKVIFSR